MSGENLYEEESKLRYVIDSVEQTIKEYKTDYKSETNEEFNKCLNMLKLAGVLLHRINWLVSCDDGEDTFHERLKNDLVKLANE